MNKMRQSEVSVIIPVFNASGTVASAIYSALDNTQVPLELVCVDDGSTDDSANILEQMSREDDRITVIRLGSNVGVSAARNKGLDWAKSNYISFLDADDSVASGALDLLHATIVAQNCDIAVGNVLHLMSRAAMTSATENASESNVIVTNMRESARLQLLSGHHCCNLYRRELLESHHIRFNTDLSLGEDQLFQATAMIKANSIAMIDDIVYIYNHYHDTSLSKKPPSLKSLSDDIKWKCCAARLFIDHGLHGTGMALLNDWSYSISTYWIKIPSALTLAETSQFFTLFRELAAEFRLPLWHDKTLALHRHILESVMAGQDELVFSFLKTEASRLAAISNEMPSRIQI